ncbi:HeH/LEM domain-containing protein [Acinetobacter baumannii]
MQAQLTAKGIDFPSNANKADLQALLDKANAPAQ